MESYISVEREFQNTFFYAWKKNPAFSFSWQAQGVCVCACVCVCVYVCVYVFVCVFVYVCNLILKLYCYYLNRFANCVMKTESVQSL